MHCQTQHRKLLPPNRVDVQHPDLKIYHMDICCPPPHPASSPEAGSLTATRQPSSGNSSHQETAETLSSHTVLREGHRCQAVDARWWQVTLFVIAVLHAPVAHPPNGRFKLVWGVFSSRRVHAANAARENNGVAFTAPPQIISEHSTLPSHGPV
jgi:hypothetical protein